MLGGISIWQLLIVLAIVVLIFGTRKLRDVGGDLGGFIRNFKSAMKEGEQQPPALDRDDKRPETGQPPPQESAARRDDRA